MQSILSNQGKNAYASPALVTFNLDLLSFAHLHNVDMHLSDCTSLLAQAGVIGMTNTDMQLLEPVKHFSYVKCTIPWGAGYGSAHVHNAQMQIFSSMLTAPAHQPRSECHYAQISTLLEQSAVKEALEAIIKQGLSNHSNFVGFQVYPKTCLCL